MSIKDDNEQDIPDNKVIFPTSKLAVASLIFGILTIWPLRIFAAIPAIICGHLALRKIKASQGNLSGKGYAQFGLIVGYIDISILVIAAITLPFLAFNVEQAVQNLQTSSGSH